MPEMQPLKPCARCEQEFPESFFDSKESVLCKRCNEEFNTILRKKYNIIETALLRAKLRRSHKNLTNRMKPARKKDEVAAVGG